MTEVTASGFEIQTLNEVSRSGGPVQCPEVPAAVPDETIVEPSENDAPQNAGDGKIHFFSESSRGEGVHVGEVLGETHEDDIDPVDRLRDQADQCPDKHKEQRGKGKQGVAAPYYRVLLLDVFFLI